MNQLAAGWFPGWMTVWMLDDFKGSWPLSRQPSWFSDWLATFLLGKLADSAVSQAKPLRPTRS